MHPTSYTVEFGIIQDSSFVDSLQHLTFFFLSIFAVVSAAQLQDPAFHNQAITICQ